MQNPHVLIAGAGPVGLVSALVLGHHGVRVTVVEAAHSLTHDLRASTFHPPTLDMLAPFGVTPHLISKGLIARYTQQRDRVQGVIAQFDMALLQGQTEYPFRLQCEQWHMTEYIATLLAKMPHVRVQMGASLESVTHLPEGARAVVTIDGAQEVIEADFLIGADGARSAVRRHLGFSFDGYTYPERFLVISTEFEFADHMPRLSYVNYCSDPEQWCVLLRVPAVWRVLFPTDTESSDEACLAAPNAERLLQGLVRQATPYETVHRSLYKVHQRVAGTFRQNRVLLAGDAAHINNPLGGMGMNGGVHDAMNLCGKILGVIRRGDDFSVLDRYERQRRTIAIEYINASTARNKKEIEERDPAVRKRTQDELRATADDPVLATAYLRKTSMLDALARAESIE
jgi:3-(3-hydroxy-phenyl)propionate hydroxylase